MFGLAAFLSAAEFKPYGSARIGYWYENENEDWSSTGDSKLLMNYQLQSNSRFGARIENGEVSGRVEFGGTGSMRLLYAKYKASGWSLVIGQDNTGVVQLARQVWNADQNLKEWGAIDDGRRAQIRFEFANGLYFSLIKPEIVDAQGASQDKNVLLPKLNLGYNGKLSDDISWQGVVGLNHYSYDDNAGALDHTVLAYIVGLMFDFDLNPVNIRTHFNYGQNTANYGLKAATVNKAIYDAVKDEIVDVATMGGFVDLSYKLSANTLMGGGVSYISSDSDNYDNPDSAMAAYLQMEHRFHKNFRFTPEVGLMNKMKDVSDNEQGSMLYFGTQLRMDF